jgi:ribosomal protein L29
MKRKEIDELKRCSAAELASRLVQLKEKLRVLLMNHHAGKVKNVREISSLRRDIARVLTFQRIASQESAVKK